MLFIFNKRFILATLLLFVFVACANATEATYAITFNEQAVGVSTMQFQFLFPSPVTDVSLTVATQGPSAIAADKGVSINHVDNQRVNVLIFGLNQNTIPTGVVANITGDVSGITEPTLPVENIVLSDPNGQAVTPSTDVLLVALSTSADPRTIILTWTDSPSPDIAGYHLYHDTMPITSDTIVNLTPIVITGRENRTYTFTNLPNATHYFILAYIDSVGLKGWSNTVNKMIQIGPVPGVLTIVNPE
jgi:hypothetical protein